MNLLAALEALHIYGSVAIVAFGWALARLLHFAPEKYELLWFAGALLVFNIDRLRPDPADEINLPRRAKNSARLRHWSVGILLAAALTLINVPLILRDRLLLVCTLGGALVCFNYSVPIAGFRLKNLPLLKTFFAPAAVAVACLAPPFLEQPLRVSLSHFTAAAAWTLVFLFFNMTLCDLRDLAGDRATGIRSVPVVLGEKRTRVLLAALVFGSAALAWLASRTALAGDVEKWRRVSILSSAYLAVLFIATQKPRGESFYTWFVEGMLFVPLLAWIGG